MLVVRIELISELKGIPEQPGKALVVSDHQGHGLDGDDRNVITVWDAHGRFHKHGVPGQRGPVGYALWMADKNRFEIFTLD